MLDPEQLVGRWWHRWASAAGSYPSHPEAGVALTDCRQRLAVFYRALGGPGGVRLAAADSRESRHRLRWRQRLGFGAYESLVRPVFDGEVLALPEVIDFFPSAEQNTALYRWLAAWFAFVDAPEFEQIEEPDPLRSDLLFLSLARATAIRVLAEWPGLKSEYVALCAATRALRPVRQLGSIEAAVESVVTSLLGGVTPETAPGKRFLAFVENPSAVTKLVPAPPHYRPFLPVPLWGDVVAGTNAPQRLGDSLPGQSAADADERRHRTRFRPSDQPERKDSLIFNRFEFLLSIAEMLNINRSVDDDDVDAARQAAETVEEITVADHSRRVSSRLRLDLDLAPAGATDEQVRGEHIYPEWDYRRRAYLPSHCRVTTRLIEGGAEDWSPDAEARRRIARVRRQFEALRPRRRVLSGERDGDELDLAAVIRTRADIASGCGGSERVYRQARNVDRDLSVGILIDASLSTDSYVDGRRVLDVEKEAVLALMHGLESCGDDHGVFAFSSKSRNEVNVSLVKHFDEPVGETVRRRLCALKPGFYTRIGAALRHVQAQLESRPTRHRLLLLITDGKPNDIDVYEGRYGVEDTRCAIRDARRSGFAMFGITIDRKARDYFPYLFGPGGYSIVPRIDKLPDALPAIYRQITA